MQLIADQSRERRARVLALAGDHCDLEWRLGVVPPSSVVRGVYFRSVYKSIERMGKWSQFAALCDPPRVSLLRWYPMTEFLPCLVGAGAVAASPAHVHDGMRQVTRLHATVFAESVLAKVMMGLLSPNPRRLLQQGVTAQRQTCSNARWELEFPAERMAVMRMREEAAYIESAMVGAAEGTFDTIGMRVDVECRLDSPFNGTHILRW